MTEIIHEGREDKFGASVEQLSKMHDLIEKIQHRQYEQETDIRNLNNLFHVCLGTGIRSKEFDGQPAPTQSDEVVER
jgi:protein-disulfide isomerase-like protein with CxxC motif